MLPWHCHWNWRACRPIPLPGSIAPDPRRKSSPLPMPASPYKHALARVLPRMLTAAAAAGRPRPRLLAVSKTQSATAVSEMATALRDAAPGMNVTAVAPLPAFGENNVQEALAKQAALGSETL